MWALVWNIPCRVSVNLELASLAWIVWPRALMTPGVSAGSPSAPARLPMASTGVPAATVLELPMVATASLVAPWICSSATSAVTSAPTTRAGYCRPLAVILTATLVASRITWLLVRTSAPAALMITPVPSAVSPS